MCSRSGFRQPRIRPRPPVISVLVCSPVRLYREGMVEILDRDPGVTVIGSAADAREARARASALTPAIVLLDTTLETTRALAGIRPAPRVVAFAMSEDDRGCARRPRISS